VMPMSLPDAEARGMDQGPSGTRPRRSRRLEATSVWLAPESIRAATRCWPRSRVADTARADGSGERAEATIGAMGGDVAEVEEVSVGAIAGSGGLGAGCAVRGPVASPLNENPGQRNGCGRAMRRAPR